MMPGAARAQGASLRAGTALAPTARLAVRAVSLLSKAASAFIPRSGFVKHHRWCIDSAAFFASADVTSQPFSRALIPIQRISEQKQKLE
jgi:hypothetical protein